MSQNDTDTSHIMELSYMSSVNALFHKEKQYRIDKSQKGSSLPNKK